MTRKACYRQSLIAAIRVWFPWQFFARWKLRKGLWWTPQRIFWMAVLMAWAAEQTLRDRFEAVRDLVQSLFPKWRLGDSYAGWIEAQARWLGPLQPALAKRLRQQMQRLAGAYWKREGWCAFAADGSRIECPRTRSNEEAFGRAGRKKTGPQLYWTTLWHMGTGLPWDYRVGPGTASERRHLEDMLSDLPPGALVVADAGFTGYDFYRRLNAAGHQFLLRVGANVHLLCALGYVEREGADTVYLWPEKRRHEQPIVLRLLELSQGRKGKMYLVTNVLDTRALSKRTAAVLYEMRWGVEVFYRSTKQTLQKRKMLSHSAEAAQCELTWAVLGVWLLGLITVAAVLERGGDPLSWSAALARQRVRQYMRWGITPRRCRQTLHEKLAEAVHDTYQRKGSKQARSWPHKKKEQSPGEPKLTVATKKQCHAAQKLKQQRSAA